MKSNRGSNRRTRRSSTGSNTGSNSGLSRRSNSGTRRSNSASNTGSNSGLSRGSNSALNTGSNSGLSRGSNSALNTGSNSGLSRGSNRGSNTGQKSGSLKRSNSGTASLNQGASTSKHQKTGEFIKVVTKDKRVILIETNIAKMFVTLKTMMEFCDIEKETKLELITYFAMKKMIEYAELHVNDPPIPEETASRERRMIVELKEPDKTFVEQLNISAIFELIVAANYLNFQLLLDVLCKRVADIIKTKNVDEIRQTFNIRNDFTQQEEANMKQENNWIEKF